MFHKKRNPAEESDGVSENIGVLADAIRAKRFEAKLQAGCGDYGLALQQFDWGHPNELQTQWLVSQGVSFRALLCPWPIGATRAIFDGDYFIRDAGGVNVLTFVAFDAGVPIDIVAWSPKTDELATYLGRAALLGDQDDCWNPASWFAGSALRAHKSPLDWLKADRDGIYIVRPDRSYAMLGHVSCMVCTDTEHAETLEKWCAPPKPHIRFLVPSAEGQAA